MVLAGVPIKEPEEILELYIQRQVYYGTDLHRMRIMQTLMNNEMPVPLPELTTEEQSLVANIALRAQDDLAERIAGVDPVMFWPSTHPSFEAADKRALSRTRIMTGWHEENDLYAIRSKRAKHFLSWAASPILVKPDGLTKRPKWEVRRPLETFFPPGSFDELVPTDSISVNIMTYQQLLKFFDYEVVNGVTKPPNWNWDNDIKNYDIEFEVLEYIDSNEISMILVGHTTEPVSRYRREPSLRNAIRIAYSPNLAHRPLVVCPGRICLDAQLGHFDGIVGMYQARAAMTALMVIAQRKTVWPTTWVEGFPNSPEEPDITQDPDPYRGIPGMIANGKISQASLDPSFRTLEVIDRMEEGERKDAGIPSEMLGSSRTHISGRRGAQVMAATIDNTVAHAHRRFARSLKEENKIAIAIDKAYYPTKKSYFIETRGYTGEITYTPAETWETDAHVVEYPLAGSDLSNLPIEGGQRVQMETMSLETFMDIDPLIKDKAAEIQRMDREALKRAFKAMVQGMAANPDPMAGIQPIHLAMLDKEVESGTELLKAFIKVNEEVQRQQQEEAERQAAAAPPTPETQPGTSTPGAAGTPQAASTIPEPPQSLQRYTQLLGSLGTAQQAGRYRAGQ
jgi:hypothetical protein